MALAQYVKCGTFIVLANLFQRADAGTQQARHTCHTGVPPINTHHHNNRQGSRATESPSIHNGDTTAANRGPELWQAQ